MASRGVGSTPRVGGRRLRGANSGNTATEGVEVSDSDLPAQGVPRRQRKAANAAVAAGVDPSTSLALVSNEGRGMPPPQQGPCLLPPPLSAPLLSCYGGFSPNCLRILENFFAMYLQYGRKEVVDLLVGLSSGMMRAVDTHTKVKNDMLSVNARAQELFESKQLLDVACGELSAEVEELKVCLLNSSHFIPD